MKTIMLILDGTIGADAPALLARLHEDTPACTIMMYAEWLATHSSCTAHHEEQHPDGIIYMRVAPEIAFARIQKHALAIESDITIDDIEQVYRQKEKLFIENKNNHEQLQTLPVLVLNGNIDFQTDFAQYYNHLFYIRRIIQQIQKKKDIESGIYKEKAPHRHCC